MSTSKHKNLPQTYYPIQDVPFSTKIMRHMKMQKIKIDIPSRDKIINLNHTQMLKSSGR